MVERGLVDVEIVKKGDGTYEDGATRSADNVKIKTNRGDAVWVSESDVIARKPNPEELSKMVSKPVDPWLPRRPQGMTQDEFTWLSNAVTKAWRRIYG